MMQINRFFGFDLNQALLFWRVIIIKNRLPSFVRIVVLPRKNGPPQDAANQHDEDQR